MAIITALFARQKVVFSSILTPLFSSQCKPFQTKDSPLWFLQKCSGPLGQVMGVSIPRIKKVLQDSISVYQCDIKELQSYIILSSLALYSVRLWISPILLPDLPRILCMFTSQQWKHLSNDLLKTQQEKRHSWFKASGTVRKFRAGLSIFSPIPK